MKRMLSLFTVCLLLSVAAHAQPNGSSYETAIGVKVYPGAITVKHFIQPNRALEGLGYFWNDGFRFTGLYEIHGDIESVDGLKWYVGPGVHFGVWNREWRDRYPNRNSGVAIGIDGVVGLDYKISGAPLSVSVDWQPSFNLIGYSYFEGAWGGFAIRYTLK